MADFAIVDQSADPLGLADAAAIILVSVEGGPVSDYHESLGYNQQFIEAAVKELKPVEEWSIEYELHGPGDLTVPMGVAVNTSYLVTGLSASYSSSGRPTVSVSCMKPSADAIIKAYAGGAQNVVLSGGFGVVDVFGAATATDYISSSLSISMQTAEADHPTSGDYLTAGLLTYGFKREVTVQSYDVIAIPATGNPHQTGLPVAQSRDGWKTYAVSWWEYLDAA